MRKKIHFLGSKSKLFDRCLVSQIFFQSLERYASDCCSKNAIALQAIEQQLP